MACSHNAVRGRGLVALADPRCTSLFGALYSARSALGGLASTLNSRLSSRMCNQIPIAVGAGGPMITSITRDPLRGPISIAPSTSTPPPPLAPRDHGAASLLAIKSVSHHRTAKVCRPQC